MHLQILREYFPLSALPISGRAWGHSFGNSAIFAAIRISSFSLNTN